MTLTKEIIRAKCASGTQRLHRRDCLGSPLHRPLRLALLGLERDTRPADGSGGQSYADVRSRRGTAGLRDGYASEGDIIAVIADAMEDPMIDKEQEPAELHGCRRRARSWPWTTAAGPLPPGLTGSSKPWRSRERHRLPGTECPFRSGAV